MQLKRDEALRQELSRKVDFKNERMAAIEEQRRSLMEELEDTRKEIAAHDTLLKVCHPPSLYIQSSIRISSGA